MLPTTSVLLFLIEAREASLDWAACGLRGEHPRLPSILCSLSTLRCRAAGCASPACKAVYLRGHTLLYPEDPGTWCYSQGGGEWALTPWLGEVAFLRSGHLLISIFLRRLPWAPHDRTRKLMFGLPPCTPQEILLLAGLFTLALKLALEFRVNPLTLSSSGFEGPDVMCWHI